MPRKSPLTLSPVIANTTTALIWMLSLCIVLHHCVWVEIPTALLAALEVTLLGLTLFNPRSTPSAMKANWLLLAFLGVMALSLALHSHPLPSLRWMRFGLLTVAMALFSPLITTGHLTRLRLRLLQALYLVGVAVVVICFCLYTFDKINGTESLRTNFGYAGILRHGMTLSALSSLVAVASLYLLFDNAKYRYAVLCVAIMGVVMTVAAGSRISVVAMGAGITAVVVAKWRQTSHTLRHHPLKAGVMLLVTLSMVASSTRAIEKKNAVAAANGSIIFSREQMWHDRLEEWEQSPWLGIGYANQYTLHGYAASLDIHGNQRETLEEYLQHPEPGSSWLTILTYSGILGALLYLAFLMWTIQGLWRRRHEDKIPLRLTLLLMLSINGLCEGWMFFPGALLMPLWWLLCCNTKPAKE